MKKTTRRGIEATLFILPLLTLVLFVAIPLVQAVIMSFSDYDMLSGSREHAFVGLDNYQTVWEKARFWKMAAITGWYTLWSVFGKMLLGLIVALLLNAKFRGKGILRSLLVIPWAMPGIVVAFLFTLFLDSEYGVMNALLLALKLVPEGVPFISRADIALPVVILIGVWKNFPFVALMLLAALQNIPKELYEAADVDGAKPLQKFFRITWPMTFSVWFIMLILQLVGTIKEFDLVYLVTGGGPALATNLVGLDIYDQSFRFFKLGIASAEGILLMLLSLILAFIYYRYEFRKR
jgi:multiple sugar transport system permease protein